MNTETAASNKTEPARHNDHNDHQGKSGHERHADHAEMFRDRLWVSLALTIPIIYFAERIQEWFGYTAISFPGSSWVNPILATLLFFYAGSVFLKGATSELRDRQPAMMTLISLAISVAYLYSLVVSFGFAGKPFYWELATLLDVMLLGHWMEMRSVQSASRALDELAAMVPNTAHRLADDGSVSDISIDDLSDGDLIKVRPGEQMPADGEITEGSTSMNEAFLTGESRPVPKRPGDEVIAGAVNGDGALTVSVTRTGEDTTLSQIMRLVEDAQASRGRFQTLASRAAFWLTIIAIGVAVPTFAAWMIFGSEGAGFAVTRTVTVLVITCPHALGLAIPLVNMNATTISANNGILVRNREAFERGRDIAFVAFDKTGTLTTGTFAVSDITTDGTDGNEALALAAALEQSSEHSLGAAIVSAARERGVTIPDGESVEAVPGNGITGKIDDRSIRVGRPEWAAELEMQIPSTLAEALNKADERGESAVVLMADDTAIAVISMADQIRDSAREAVKRLQELGVTPVMVTGDAEAVARSVADELGIERFHARVLPEDKANIINKLKQEGPTAFVGDGINDAPALLAADLGIAIGAGTNVAIESADLVLVDDDPADVTRALNLSKATHRKMIQNLVWATGYNAFAIPLAAGVGVGAGILLSPAIGAILMSLSTVIVAINAMLLRRTDLDRA